jgi:hypothetical protein
MKRPNDDTMIWYNQFLLNERLLFIAHTFPTAKLQWLLDVRLTY